MVSTAITTATTLTLIASTCLADGWNSGTGGNPARNGQSPEIGPETPELLWSGGLPAIVSQQAVIEGNVVAMARIANFDIPTGTTIVAYDLHTGDELWTTQLPYDFPGSSWRSRVSAIRDGQVYATRAGNTNLDSLYALDVADGDIIWQSEDLVDEGSTESATFAPNGDPIVGSFGFVTRIDRTDGTTVWTADRSCPTSNGCEAAVFGDRVYLWQSSPQGPKVRALDLATGAFLYDSDGIGGGFVRQVGLFVGPDGTIYAPRTQNNDLTDFFVALEDTGEGFLEKWCVPLGYVPFSSFGVGPDGSVYTYSDSDEILRLDPDTGEVIDTSIPLLTGSKNPHARIAIDALGRLYVTNGGFANGRVYSFNPDLSLRWDEPLGGNNVGGPALGQDGILVVCGTGTDIRAYQTPGAACPEDVNGDGTVNVSDLTLLIVSWGPCDDCAADIDGNGDVGVDDLVALILAWGDC